MTITRLTSVRRHALQRMVFVYYSEILGIYEKDADAGYNYVDSLDRANAREQCERESLKRSKMESMIERPNKIIRM